MKRNRRVAIWTELLKNKSFLMFFYNASLRTHISFETAATELGASAQYRTPSMGWIKNQPFESGETLKDAIKVMSRYVNGIGVRITLDQIPYQGAGNEILKEYARWSNVPIINMADDRFHPCQAFADVMGWAEALGERRYNYMSSLKGKKLLLTWAKSGLARPWSSVQSHLLLASRLGMQVTLARPSGYDLETDVYEQVRKNCTGNGTEFEIIDDPISGYKNADVVYARNWVSPEAYKDGKFQKENEIRMALNHSDWKITLDKMFYTNDAIFANPMPVDRDNEVESAIVDSERCVIYDVAENRLHVQKAILAACMSNISL